MLYEQKNGGLKNDMKWYECWFVPCLLYTCFNLQRQLLIQYRWSTRSHCVIWLCLATWLSCNLKAIFKKKHVACRKSIDLKVHKDSAATMVAASSVTIIYRSSMVKPPHKSQIMIWHVTRRNKKMNTVYFRICSFQLSINNQATRIRSTATGGVHLPQAWSQQICLPKCVTPRSLAPGTY